MKQQINLYQPLFRKPVVIFSAIAMAQVLVAFLLSAALVYGYGKYQMKHLAAQHEQLQVQLANVEQRVKTLQAEFPPPVENEILKQDLERARARVARTSQVAAALSQGALGNTSGLSAYLAGAARQHVEGTWLTALKVRDGGAAIGMQGYSLDPKLVPKYVQKLSRENAFNGKAFRQLNVARDETHGALVGFTMMTDGITFGDKHER